MGTVKKPPRLRATAGAGLETLPGAGQPRLPSSTLQT